MVLVVVKGQITKFQKYAHADPICGLLGLLVKKNGPRMRSDAHFFMNIESHLTDYRLDHEHLMLVPTEPSDNKCRMSQDCSWIASA